jgi:hypothetical protein
VANWTRLQDMKRTAPGEIGMFGSTHVTPLLTRSFKTVVRLVTDVSRQFSSRQPLTAHLHFLPVAPPRRLCTAPGGAWFNWTTINSHKTPFRHDLYHIKISTDYANSMPLSFSCSTFRIRVWSSRHPVHPSMPYSKVEIISTDRSANSNALRQIQVEQVTI